MPVFSQTMAEPLDASAEAVIARLAGKLIGEKAHVLVVGADLMARLTDPDDRATADRIHARYVDNITRFAIWLVPSGR